ncbi:MAG: aldo/keto reductase [Bacteroidota bacterium]
MVNNISERVPKMTLSNGVEIPAIGLGTFGSDHVSHEAVAKAVEDAIRFGYRHIDCASVYGNEKQIGEVLSALFKECVVTREDLWITSKVWNDQHREVEKACLQSLKDLQLDYLDLYLVHWPFPNYHAPGCGPDARNPDSRPFSVEEFMDTWRQMETLVEKGLVKHIGTSNMTIPKFEAVWPLMKIKPVANELELHPCFQQEELMKYLKEKNIQPIGYSPIGSPNRPERDRTTEDAVDMEEPVVQEIAKNHGIHPAAVCMKWAVQNGQIPIPFSVNPKNYKSNLLAVMSDPLTDDEMKAMKKAEKGSRLIKGQVFLWEGAKGWEDLWDLNGEIVK